MKSAVRQTEAGYTIIETMIFLIISGALMASAALLFSGKIARSQFTQAVQQFDSSINNVINQVSTGTYSNDQTISCSKGSDQPVVSKGPSTQGTNTSCVFIGKVLQPGLADDKNKVNIYTVAGNRLFNGDEATSLQQARPVAVDQSTSADSVDMTEYKTLISGMEITSITVAGTPVGAIGFFQTFGQTGSQGGLHSGAQNVQVVPLGSGLLTQAELDSQVTGLSSKAGSLVAAAPIKICIADGGSNLKASITIGLNNSNISTDVIVGDASCK